MNKSESKYFHTAQRMDEALIALLEHKDLTYITVKEICERAGVNRSTFYLHYETIADLVDETAAYVTARFASYFPQAQHTVQEKLQTGTLDDLILVTREYLLPYLHFVRENRRIYRATFRNPGNLQAYARFGSLKREIFEPILARFGVPAAQHKYYIAYYIEGIMAIVKVWLDEDCADDVERIADVIAACVSPHAKAHDAE